MSTQSAKILNLKIPRRAEHTQSAGSSEAEGAAPSPFLPNSNVQYAFDSTSLEDLKRCARLYYYTMIEGWRPKNESVHLRFGDELHQTLRHYESERATNVPHDVAVTNAISALLARIGDWKPSVEENGKAAESKNRNTLLRSAIWYLDHYKNDAAKTLIMDNGEAATELSFRFEIEWGPTADQPYLLCGHLDRVVEYNGELLVMDHKTTSNMPYNYFDQWKPHNQMSLYTLAGGIIFNSPIKGVIIDAIQVQVTQTQFHRGVTYRTQDELDEWVHDLKFHFDNALMYAAEGYWPMNDTACDKYGGCRFRQVCSKSPVVRQAFLESNFTQEDIWNPLKPR